MKIFKSNWSIPLVFFLLGIAIGYTYSSRLTNKVSPLINTDVSKGNSNVIAEYLPLRKGGVWEYKGTKKEQSDKGVETSEIGKRVEVIDVTSNSATDTFSVLVDGQIEKWLVRENIIDFEPDESEDKFILMLPLYVGQKWGDNVQLRNRDDGYYVWEVEQKLSKEVLGKKYNECFRIAYKTLPATSYKIFCYGIGIVEEGYVHNGTVLEETYILTTHLR